MFAPEERVSILNAALSDKKNVKTLFSEDMAVEVARRIGAEKLVRGVRGAEDEAYENAMADFNREHGFDTVFISPDDYRDVSSTSARELLKNGDFRLIPNGAIIVTKEILQKKGEAH